MKRPPFIEKLPLLDRVTRYELFSMIEMKSYPPNQIIPIDDDHIYIVKRGMIKCSFINDKGNMDVSLLVEEDVFGNVELIDLLPFKYGLQYSSLENTCLFLIPKKQWNSYVLSLAGLSEVWTVLIDRQKCITNVWLSQFRRVRKERLLVRLLQEKPQLLKRDRLRHVCRILNIEQE